MRIHGEITKIKEVQTRGYDLPNIQTTGMDHTGQWVPTLTLSTFANLQNINGLIKKISITCSSAASLNEVYFTETDATGTDTIFLRAMFFISFEFDLNDFPISSANTYSVTFGNYTGGWVYFTANISYIEI